jgi:hypothetical protein
MENIHCIKFAQFKRVAAAGRVGGNFHQVMNKVIHSICGQTYEKIKVSQGGMEACLPRFTSNGVGNPQ